MGFRMRPVLLALGLAVAAPVSGCKDPELSQSASPSSHSSLEEGLEVKELPAASGASADTLRVTVSGMKARQGNLRIAVFDEAHRDEFPEGKYLHGAEVPATAEQLTVEIPAVEAGKYAIAVFQDLNENGKLDKNVLRIPKEPYGFSGAWKRGGSSFKKALFSTADVEFSVSIKLK
jgi:uncharacterized protein (DUF2141 family)